MKISLNGISVQHPSAKPGAVPALREQNLTVRAGEQLAIIGPSGAGKTTLLHLLACALKPSAGSMLLNDQDPWQLSRGALQKLRGALFLAPQVPPLPPRQRVVTAVLAGRLPNESLWASLRSLFYPTDIALAERALAGFDVGDKLFDRVDRLSGGERQRVGLARALVSQASLILVDEPLSALDPTRSQHAIETLTRAAQERGATLVATLHHVEMALAHFPRIVGLRDGQVAFDLPAAEVTPELLQALYAQHLHELTGLANLEADDLPTDPAPVVMHCR
ncbi:ABC transporter related [Rhodoferax ferrireducens T118]|uniref:Phosphonates import ATP-binding protein PhnC 2 n=1 Tax=Albidiferax ferrireducens (strain ATCC BAA-621 / DSM 15236 / T118) TaxID=338969 RepID=PHNC2_ALBFT|nr:ATP-binding cassette domain-containing protein [Rhodoferax ferrireducens]Q21Y06.1 RecName: Full=Phosphonates import ATP-binding protein PhnC 2 [Rhodoferax ferrireducens T118]ABD69347.1 ABC transporter related [Rhodoferax ferrireducens T118]